MDAFCASRCRMIPALQRLAPAHKHMPRLTRSMSLSRMGRRAQRRRLPADRACWKGHPHSTKLGRRCRPCMCSGRDWFRPRLCRLQHAQRGLMSHSVSQTGRLRRTVTKIGTGTAHPDRRPSLPPLTEAEAGGARGCRICWAELQARRGARRRAKVAQLHLPARTRRIASNQLVSGILHCAGCAWAQGSLFSRQWSKRAPPPWQADTSMQAHWSLVASWSVSVLPMPATVIGVPAATSVFLNRSSGNLLMPEAGWLSTT